MIETNNVNELMNRDPLDLTPDDISSIIAYHRKNRANHEAGVRPRKEVGPVQKIDLAAIGIVKAPSAPVTRRF